MALDIHVLLLRLCRAARAAQIDSVVIAKMDGTENEHADVEVKGFPTILFFPAGESKPITFSGGDRSLKVRARGRCCPQQHWGVAAACALRRARGPGQSSRTPT